jgi:Fe-S cluster assembly scaffold protein SufB
VVRMSYDKELMEVSHEILEGAIRAGVSLDEDEQAGLYMHVDQRTVYSNVNEMFKGKIEIMDIKDALRKYNWLEDYRWNLINPDDDEYTKAVAHGYSGGYFLRILPGAFITLPLQSCLLMTQHDSEQKVHNIIIAEEGSKAQILTTCVQHTPQMKVTHLGVSEIYVKENAKLTFTMVHHWGTQTKVRSRSFTHIAEGGEYINNYICLTPAHDVQMFPKALCEGNRSKVLFNSILFVQEGSNMDIGSWAVLDGKGSSAELNARAICIGNSKLIARITVDGNSEDCRGHIECRGLVLDDNSVLEAIPILHAATKGPDLTHEAAVGKLSEREIMYLMSRKMGEDEAISALVRGFLDIEILGLPESVRKGIDKVAEIVVDAS